MTEFVKVATVDELADPGMLAIEVDDQFAILFLVDGVYSCIDDVCTHDGGTLSDGDLADGCIACPRHGAKFDIVTGAARSMPATQATAAHEVRIEGNNLLVKLQSP